MARATTEFARLDDLTVEAVTILAEAVRESAIPGVLEFRTIAGALDRAARLRSRADLRSAGNAFDRLDGDIRGTIAEAACDKAAERKRSLRKQGVLFAARSGRISTPD